MPDHTEILLKAVLNRKDLSSRCCKLWYDVTLPTNLPDTFFLIFQNFYTASISIAQDMPDGSKILIDNLRLMECAHNENDAQQWHQISSEEFKNKVNLSKTLKVFIFQPSNSWLKFELRNFKVSFGEDSRLTRSISSFQDDSSDTISSAILSDWKLITEASFAQSKLRDLPEVFYQGGNEVRRNGKRSGRRKDRRASTAVTSSTAASDSVPSTSASFSAKI